MSNTPSTTARSAPVRIRSRAGALAEQEAECADDDGFAGAGFAGQHVEARRQRKRERLDDREVLDAQLGQHQRVWSRSARPPQPSFRVSTEKNVEPGKRTIESVTLGATDEERVTDAERSAHLAVDRHQKLVGPIVRVHPQLAYRRRARAAESRAYAARSASATMDSSVGTTTGPPAERLYAVEPVGVEHTMPSAAYVPIGSPFAETLRCTTRANPPL